MTTKKTATSKKKTGRPSLYTEALADKIISLIEEGYSERQIGKMPGMPSVVTLWKWKEENPEFLKRSARAREISAELYDDKRREAAEWLLQMAENRNASGESFPKGVVDAVRAVMQEHARSAALRDDSRFGDRKTVKVDATEDAKGMAEVYARMLEAQKDE